MWIPIVLSVAFLSLLALGWYYWRKDADTPVNIAWYCEEFCRQEGDGKGGLIDDANIVEARRYMQITCRLLQLSSWRKRRQLIKQLGDQWGIK